jgi:hypothetical protein
VRGVLLRTSPVVTKVGSVLFSEQQALAGPSSGDQQLSTPLLREIDAGGREVLRRALPLQIEGYEGRAAIHRGRLFLAGQVLPSAGARGAVRAFDVPGLAAAEDGWMTDGGSMARDHRAR